MSFCLRTRVGTHFKSFLVLSMGLLGPALAVGQVQTEMRLFSDSYISPAFEATSKTNYQFVGAQVKTEASSDDILKMDLAGGMAMGSPLMNYLNISEFYTEIRQSKTEVFFLGRKKMLWSELDARWDMGVWEPLFKWNPLSSERQGLTGLFWQIDKSFYSLTLFASPFFIPDQGPSFEIQDGSFVKGNPWFRRPPESIRLWEETTAIDYRFDKPNEAQIVLQNSFGAKVSFGSPNSLRAQFSYIYKPANQLAIGYSGNLISEAGQWKGVVDLQPQVFYHSLAAADVTYKNRRLRMGVSTILDRPNKENTFEEKWNHPVFEDALLVTPFVEWNNGRVGVSLQHLEIFGGKITEVGDLANAERAPLMTRYAFQQAQQVAVLGNFTFSKNRKLLTKVSLTHSEKNDFDLIRVSSRLKLSGLWSVLGEMQLVRAGAMTVENQNEISQFVNNDRFMIGAAYVF